MTEATAPKTRKTRTVKPAGPPIDFAAMTVQDAPAPSRAGGKDSRPNPFVNILADSAASKTPVPGGGWRGAGKAVTVLDTQVQEVINLIRYASNAANIGSAIVYATRKPAPSEPQSGYTYGDKSVPAGQTRVTFCAKNRKQRRESETLTDQATLGEAVANALPEA